MCPENVPTINVKKCCLPYKGEMAIPCTFATHSPPACPGVAPPSSAGIPPPSRGLLGISGWGPVAGLRVGNKPDLSLLLCMP